jgi:hypothetical protein
VMVSSNMHFWFSVILTFWRFWILNILSQWKLPTFDYCTKAWNLSIKLLRILSLQLKPRMEMTVYCSEVTFSKCRIQTVNYILQTWVHFPSFLHSLFTLAGIARFNLHYYDSAYIQAQQVLHYKYQTLKSKISCQHHSSNLQ